MKKFKKKIKCKVLKPEYPKVCTWVKFFSGQEWAIMGYKLVPNDKVVVLRRDGTVHDAVVAQIRYTSNHGVTVASIVKEDPTGSLDCDEIDWDNGWA